VRPAALTSSAHITSRVEREVVHVKVVSSIAVSIAALALCATAATAAPARHDSTQSSFCATAKGIVKYLRSTLTLSASGVATQTPANLKLEYTTVVSREGGLLGAAPASLKANLRRAFSFVNLVKADFVKAGWQVAKMTPYFPALAANAQANARPITAVKSYLDDTCHLPI
jgi:hypothetical protein